MQGYVVSAEYAFAFIKGQDGQEYFCHKGLMPADEVGRLYLLAGELVEFDAAPPERENQRHHLAINVKVISAREPVPDNYAEEGPVARIGGGHCFIDRPYGGNLLLHSSEVRHFTTAWEKGVKFFIGQWWSYRVVPSTTNPGKWCAAEAVEMQAADIEELPQEAA